MKTVLTFLGRVNSLLIGLFGRLRLVIAARYFEPRLLPLAAVAGPTLAGLAYPPNGRRVFREMGLAVLLTSGVISIMLFMPAPA